MPFSELQFMGGKKSVGCSWFQQILVVAKSMVAQLGSWRHCLPQSGGSEVCNPMEKRGREWGREGWRNSTRSHCTSEVWLPAALSLTPGLSNKAQPLMKISFMRNFQNITFQWRFSMGFNKEWLQTAAFPSKEAFITFLLYPFYIIFIKIAWNRCFCIFGSNQPKGSGERCKYRDRDTPRMAKTVFSLWGKRGKRDRS